MSRVRQRFKQKSFLQPSIRGKVRLGHTPYLIADRYKSVALELLSYYGPCRNISDLIHLIQGDLYYVLCRSIEMLIGMPPTDVPRRFPSQVKLYLYNLNKVIQTIHSCPPSCCGLICRWDLNCFLLNLCLCLYFNLGNWVRINHPCFLSYWD